MKEVRLTDTDRKTIATALSILIDLIKAQELNELVTVESKTIALLSCARIVEAFDLEEYMEELEDVL